jgi:hypothetical protein
MKKLILNTVIILLFALQSNAQVTEVNTDFYTQMNTVFSGLDKSRIPTGFLQDYAFKPVYLPHTLQNKFLNRQNQKQ